MNLENLIPGLAAAREAERIERGVALVGIRRSILGVEVLPIAPIHRLRLELILNAFCYSNVEPKAGDLFAFLWILSPKWTDRRGPIAELRQWRLRRLVRRIEARGRLAAASRVVRSWVESQTGDAPEQRFEEGTVDHSNSVHWYAYDAGFWLNVHGGFTLDSYARTPCLVLQGLRRVWRINHPERLYNSDGSSTVVEPTFPNRSDKLVRNWHSERREAVGKLIRENRERRN